MQATFEEALSRAEQHREQLQYDQAITALIEASDLQPGDPRPHFQLAVVQTAAGIPEAACRAALRAVELAPAGHLGVLNSELHDAGVAPPRGVYPQLGLRAAVMAFDLLIQPVCDRVARPSWWTDTALLSISERAMADTPESIFALNTRVRVLLGVGALMADGKPRGWWLEPRTPQMVREAASLLKKQSMIEPPGSKKSLLHLHNSTLLLEKAMEMEASARA